MPANAPAAVLIATIDSTTLSSLVIERLLRIPAIHEMMSEPRTPLDLEAARFRYRISADGRLRVFSDSPGARLCDRRHPRGRGAHALSAPRY